MSRSGFSHVVDVSAQLQICLSIRSWPPGWGISPFEGWVFFCSGWTCGEFIHRKCSCFQPLPVLVVRRLQADIHFPYSTRLLKETLGFLLLWACLDSALSRGCSSFFCRQSHRVSGLDGVDPGSPLFLTPYLEKGAIDEGKSPHITVTQHLSLLSVAV